MGTLSEVPELEQKPLREMASTRELSLAPERPFPESACQQSLALGPSGGWVPNAPAASLAWALLPHGGTLVFLQKRKQEQLVGGPKSHC